MPKSLLIAIFVAVAGGLAIGAQASLNNAAGRLTSATLVGLLVNFVGGLVAGAVLLTLYARQGAAFLAELRAAPRVILFISGVLGIAIIAGIAFALPKTGIAAGLAAIIAGQMVIAVIVDTFGLAGGPPISLSWARLAGLVLLALGTWLILPKSGS